MGCCPNERQAAMNLVRAEFDQMMARLRAMGVDASDWGVGLSSEGSSGVSLGCHLSINFPLPESVLPAAKRWSYS